MKEGWCGDDYLILFDGAESVAATTAYEVDRYLPGYAVVAIIGWDDFLVRDRAGGHFQIPTVPLDPKYMERREPLPHSLEFQPDDRFSGKIKWYVTPLVFGGDPKPGENMTWVNLSEHQELVRWWNDKYREMAQG